MIPAQRHRTSLPEALASPTSAQRTSLFNLDRANLYLTGAGQQVGFTPALTDANVKSSSIDSEPITLTNLLRKPFWGILIGCLMGALLVYGTSGIIYFTNLILTSQNQVVADLNRFIVWQNMTEGVSVFLTTYFLSDWLDSTLKRVWLRHLILSLVVILVYLAIGFSSYAMLGKEVFEQLSKQPSTNPMLSGAPSWYIYVMASLLIGNSFLYVLRQGRQLTRKMTEQEFQLLNLEKLKTRAELDALQAKINPHFLYNALNSIASLVHDDPAKAEEMTLLLSKLFRYSTGREASHTSSLANELDMVKTYLQVEHVRFGDRLQFSVSTADESLNALQIPQFLLQPIVENAVKHGISKRVGQGRIDVAIYRQDESLCLSVHDNGPPFPDDMGSGYGLRSIQEKLRLLYGDDASVELQNEPHKQVLLKIQLNKLAESTQE